MGIEKDISKSYFRNEYHKATVNIIFSANYLVEKLKNLLEPEGLTYQQYNILRILKSTHTPLSTLQIRELMIDKMSDTSRIVERLIKKDLVQKKLRVTDKRLVDITLTEKGIQLLEKLENAIPKIDAFTSMLSDEEVKNLNLLLDKLRDKV